MLIPPRHISAPSDIGFWIPVQQSVLDIPSCLLAAAVEVGRRTETNRSERQREEGEADGRGPSGGRIAPDGGRDLINGWAGCAGEAVRHDFSWKEDPSMQIQLCRRRRENTSHPPEKSQVCHLSHGALSPLIHPSIHPSRPVSTAFASYSHIKAPSRLLCARPLSSAVPVSRYLMFLSTPLIPHLHPIQQRLPMRSRRDAVPRLHVSTQTRCVLFELRRRGG